MAVRYRDDGQMSESWTCQRFSLANAIDDRPNDLPHLLRRVADEMERQQVRPMDVLDLTVSSEMTADGPWWSVTLYWSPRSLRVVESG